ncbi:MAG: class I SAM-dependent methyltransferase [Myxococcota bacterium]
MSTFEDSATALAWTHERQRIHPTLSDVRRHVASRLGHLVGRRARLLDVGGGAALLGEVVMARLADAAYVWVDPCASMRDLAEARLAHRPDCFFRTASLVAGLEAIGSDAAFDAAWAIDVFAARGLADAPSAVHRAVFERMAAGGRYFVCEPYAGGPAADPSARLETVDAQERAIADAGFDVGASLTLVGGLAVHEGVRPG